MEDKLAESAIQLQLVGALSLGLKVPYTSIGLAALSGAYLQFKLRDEVHVYGIKSWFDAGVGTLVFSAVSTEFFNIRHNPQRQDRIPRLEGLEAILKVSGLVAGGVGKIDIDLLVCDEFGDKNNPLLKVNRQNQPADGVQAFDMSISGTLVNVKNLLEESQKANTTEGNIRRSTPGFPEIGVRHP